MIIMSAASAYDDDDDLIEEESNGSNGHQSGTRIRTVFGCGTEMALMLDALESAIKVQRSTEQVRNIVPWLRLVEVATSDVERWSRVLGATHVTDSWLEACTDWMTIISETLVSALSYSGSERRVALELAAEESSMRLVTQLEREGGDAVAVLRNLDGNAARAANELVARMDLADRMLRAAVG